MSKSANAGELRTPVYFIRTDRENDRNGYPVITEVNVFGEGRYVLAKWVNAHGTEAFMAMQMQLREPATITMRYSPLINEQLLVYRGNDPKPYEVISIDNVQERNTWLEIKVQRRVEGR